MSIRDPEVLEALRDQPELLAIADAVEDTQRPPRTSRRRVVSRVAVVAAVGAAALVALLLWPSGGKRNPILARALAAISGGEVLHLITLPPNGPQLVDLQTGRTTVPRVTYESWTDRSLKRIHVLIRDNGRVVGEIVLHRAADTPVGPIDPAFAAIWSGYREALASGAAKLAGEGTLYGHPVYWLRFKSPLENSPGNEVAVDRNTYEPVGFRSIFAGGPADTRVLFFRMEPFRNSAFRRQTSLANPIAEPSHGSTTHVGPLNPTKPVKPWLTAGPSIARLKSTAIQRTETTSGAGTSTGFHLAYGPDGHLRESLTVDEVKRPGDRSAWRGIPAGSMRLSAGEAAEGKRPPYTFWTGYLVRDGVYVTIQTGVSRAAAIEAARALKPA